MLSCVPGPGVAPACNSLSFASPKESKQRKGDPAVCVPCASLQGNLRCSVQPGSKTTRLRLRQVFALIRLALRSSRIQKGWGKEYQYRTPEETRTRHSVSLLVLGVGFLVFGLPPSWLGRGAQRQADQGSRLSEPKASSSETPLASSTAGCPKRSAGTQTAGRLFFGDFLLAKQKKVTCSRATPGPGTQTNISV